MPIPHIRPDIAHMFGVDAIGRAHRVIATPIDPHFEGIDPLWLTQRPTGESETSPCWHALAFLRPIEKTDRRKPTGIAAIAAEFEPDEAFADAVESMFRAIAHRIEIPAQAAIERQRVGAVERVFLDHQQHS